MSKINNIDKYIEYTCSTGATPDSNLFTEEERLKIDRSTNGSDKKITKVIETIWNSKTTLKEIK